MPDPKDTSLWYKDAIVYELHVKAFRDSNGDGTGDFRGLIEQLDYLQDLGVTTLWLLPFYPSPQKDDGYDISDYRGVNPAYGTLRDFKAFVREAHARRLRVITELVVNHTSDQHPWFQAARRARPGSSRRGYYVWSDTDTKYAGTRVIFTDTETSNWTWDPVAGQYYWHRFFHHQPDLNFDNPRVLREVKRVLHYWLEMGVDGLRLDAVPYLVERDGTSCENLPETHEVIRELRREIDARYGDRVLLGEANQWPEDVRPYFGEGDECHMAFHFPLMPRIFMALSREDRRPITEILSRTPAIPESAQWALFLRNHDELTLEMVTDEERDYMYREYAEDPRMRVNIGIRRRLAPLVGNNWRRIEMLNSLLMSFPGTPVVYYGDEIGMGDNIYLGDRDGVRTPMQWSPDRNAGFSAADPARLYLPVLMDAVYGYQAVNVEAQQRNPSSLLHFMKRIIALRRQHRAFGRGTLEFLRPTNRKVLAYLRRWRGDAILCVANLARSVQPVELDLREFNGRTPLELFGHTEFPRIGELPYFLTLAPWAFYWFRLERQAEPIRLSSEALPATDVPSLIVEDTPEEVFGEEFRFTLAHDVIAPYLPRQRWFRSKAREIVAATLRDRAKIAGGFHLLLVDVEYADQARETYAMPVKLAEAEAARSVLEQIPRSVLARIRTPKGEAVLYDALADRQGCAALYVAIGDARSYATTAGGTVRAYGVGGTSLPISSGAELGPVRRLPVEQSNSSVIIDDAFVLKFFRGVENGPNPDMEITRHLTERTTFDRIAAAVGGIDYHPPVGPPATLAMLQRYVENDGDGWSFMRARLEEFLGGGPVDTAARAAALLGRRTAEFHHAVSGAWRDPAFKPQPTTRTWLRTIAEEMENRAHEALELLRTRLPLLPETARQLGEAVLSAAGRLPLPLRALADAGSEVLRIRCHGDYHLGQVLRTGDDFVLLDFEGEPLRPLAERRSRHLALKDVAGMLRSFAYAAYAGAEQRAHELASAEQGPVEERALAWREAVSQAFLGAYRETAAGASFVPADDRDFHVVLGALCLDKAMYELFYELNNRPDWATIPLRGIREWAPGEMTPGAESEHEETT